MVVRKDQLIARKTLVRIPADLTFDTPVGRVTRHAGVYVVKDLMNRPRYDRPDRVGIGPVDRGIAFGVRLADIDLA